MATPKPLLPPCGLYRTTKPLSGNEEKFPAGTLVYFHNHSDSGLPSVLAPDHNIQNRWHFHGPAVEFRGLAWADTLQKVPEEGFYMLRKELTFDGGKWPKSALVQLGYTKDANPILFIAQVRAKLEENDLFFSERGVPLQREQLSILDPVNVYTEPADGSHAPNQTH